MRDKKVFYVRLERKMKMYREKCGMTQDYVARRIKVDRSIISKWETGALEIRVFDLLNLLDLYETDNQISICGWRDFCVVISSACRLGHKHTFNNRIRR
ncbi:MAG: helix-turn-helix transcriptional regulator [Solobacterium sp.]|nr:helix-turn-helix transcriptional regulator [Solobacterium sp.]